LKYSEKYLSQCAFLYHKFHLNCPWIEHKLQLSETANE